MREIIFRGLRTDGKGWVYGSLVKNHSATRIVEDFTLASTDEYGLSHCGGDFYLVTPESVGQFTGLKDVNGKEIYEGDVVKGVLYTTGIELDINKDVRFSGGVFTVEKVYIDKIAKIEIIGNIHEKQGGTN